jgi:hypothetical protein
MAACTIQEFDIRDESDGEYGRCGQSYGSNVSILEPTIFGPDSIPELLFFLQKLVPNT